MSAPATDLSTAVAQKPAGASQRLWLDVTLGLLGHPGAVSPLGAEVLGRAFDQLERVALGRVPPRDAPGRLARTGQGRAWLNLSALLGYSRPESLAAWVGGVDPAAGAALSPLDPAHWATDDLQRLELMPSLLFRGARAMGAVFTGRLQPAWSRQLADTAWERWSSTVSARADAPIDDGLAAWIDRLLSPTAHFVADELLPRIALVTSAQRTLRDTFAHRAACQSLVPALERSLPGAPLGSSAWLMQLSRVATAVSVDEAQALQQGRSVSHPQWLELIATHGHRGAQALDVAAPDHHRRPDHLARLVGGLALRFCDDGLDLASAWEQGVQARGLARSTLAADLSGPMERASFEAAAEVVAALGGLSDAPLAAFRHTLGLVRRRLETVLEPAVSAGALSWEEVGALALEDVDALAADSATTRVATGRWLPTPDLPLTGGPAEWVGVAGGEAVGELRRCAGPLPVASRKGVVWLVDALSADDLPAVWAASAVLVRASGGLGPGLGAVRSVGRPVVVGVGGSLDGVVDGAQVWVDGATGAVQVVGEE